MIALIRRLALAPWGRLAHGVPSIAARMAALPRQGNAARAATVHGNAFAGIPQGCMLTSALRL